MHIPWQGKLYSLPLQVYTKSKGPQPNLEKELLIFVLYSGDFKSFRSMADLKREDQETPGRENLDIDGKTAQKRTE